MKSITEELVADTVPSSGRRCEKFLRLRAPLCKNALKAALILGRSGSRSNLFPNEKPQAPRGCVQLVPRHHIKVTGSLGRRRNPPAVRQRFQMPADGGLGELHDGAELGYRQLVTL